MKKLSAILTAVILTSLTFICAAPVQLDYYGVISESADSNMLKMAQDFFFTQLNAIDGISVQDKRPDTGTILRSLPETAAGSAKKITFYAEITEEKKEGDAVWWSCSFIAKTMASSEETAWKKTKEYDSYYKMLTNSKDTIHELLNTVKENTRGAESSSPYSKTMTAGQEGFDIETLSGTWNGEPFADKIVILRGGRGFIIFKNGATMNISVSSEGNSSVKVRQTGKTNASFYPDLPREKVLSVAATASPIEWNFTLKGNDMLSGTKTTLIDDNLGNITTGTQKVTWYKK